MLPDFTGAGVIERVPTVIEQGMRRCSADYYRALNLPLATYGEQAERARLLALACERRARCWSALLRWVFTAQPGVPWMFVSAVIAARGRELDAARFWHDTTRYWRQAADARDPGPRPGRDSGRCAS